MVAIGLSWCAAFGLYMLFAGQLSGTELGSGAALATLATAWSMVVRRCGAVRFAGWRSHGPPVLQALSNLVPATLRTARVLVRVAVRGGSPAKPMPYPFARGDNDDPHDRARRATAVLVACLAPDSFVVREAPGRSEVLVHGIAGRAGDPDPRWLT